MKDDEFSSAFYARALREKAREDAAEGEYDPEEHTFWGAADRLEELEEIVRVLDGSGQPSPELVASLLTRIAGSLKWGDFHHKYTYNDDMKNRADSTTGSASDS